MQFPFADCRLTNLV